MKLSLHLDNKDIATFVIYVTVGTLAGKTACHLPWKDAAVWALSSGAVLGIALKSFGDPLFCKIDSKLGPRGIGVSMACVVGAICGLSHLLSHAAATYLTKVPSTLVVTAVYPALLFGSWAMSHILAPKHPTA